MKNLLLILAALVLPLAAQAKKMETCQIQEFLGSSYDQEAKKYRIGKWTNYEFDGSDQAFTHQFKLLEGITLKLASNGEGWMSEIPAHVISLDLEDKLAEVKLRNSMMIEKGDSGRGVALNSQTFWYKRKNLDQIVISCHAEITP